MGCNCKAQNDFNKLVKRYGEETYIDNNNKIRVGLLKILRFVFAFLSGIFISLLFIIMVIPMIIYIIICIILGIEPVVKMPWLKHQKRLEKKVNNKNEGIK